MLSLGNEFCIVHRTRFGAFIRFLLPQALTCKFHKKNHGFNGSVVSLATEAKANEKDVCIPTYMELFRVKLIDLSTQTDVLPWILERGEQTGAGMNTPAHLFGVMLQMAMKLLNISRPPIWEWASDRMKIRPVLLSQ